MKCKKLEGGRKRDLGHARNLLGNHGAGFRVSVITMHKEKRGTR